MLKHLGLWDRMGTDHKVKREIKYLGFRKNLYQYVCVNKWRDNGIPVRCFWETKPAYVSYLKTQFSRGNVWCPICYDKYQKIPIKSYMPKNLELIKYSPAFITLACSGIKKRIIYKDKGTPILKTEKCGVRLGTFQLYDARHKLRTGKLKCSECKGTRFHMIERTVSQEMKLVEMIKNGNFRHLQQYYEDMDYWVTSTIKEHYKVSDDHDGI